MNLHSEGPSRAASPFRLPLAVLDGDLSGGPTEDCPLSPSRSSLVGSPPRQTGSSNIRSWTSVETSPPSSFSILDSGHFSAGRGSRFVNVPKSLSGPSSNDSSPGSYPNSLASSMARHQPDIVTRNGSSRAALPPLLSGAGQIKGNSSSSAPPAHLSHSPHARDRGSGPVHCNLAHSFRVAFGITPIHTHPISGYRRSGSTTAPGGATPFSTGFGHVQALSMPVSRSSPPITLPPLKFDPSTHSSCPTSPVEDTKMEDATVSSNGSSKPKIELPGFSEFTAASGIKNLPA